MKYLYKLLFTLSFLMVFTFSYGQSVTKDYLVNDWISTTKIFETGDTIQSSNEELLLKKDGSMIMKERGMTLPGKWEYLEGKNQLQLTLKIGEKLETVMLFIDKNTGLDLTLTQKRGDKFKTVMYVEKVGN